MIHHAPLPLPEDVKAAFHRRDSVAAVAALADMDAGFFFVPTLDKQPVKQLADRPDQQPRTRDPRVWYEWKILFPDLEIGLSTGFRFSVLDVDYPGNSGPFSGLIDSAGEHKNDGKAHILVRNPPGTRLRTRKFKDLGELITGNNYCRILADGYTFRTDAPILTIPDDHPVLDGVRSPRTETPIDIPAPTHRHHREAQRIIEALLQAPPNIASDSLSYLNGHTPEGKTPSESDYNLALLSSFWTKDPAVIAAVLLASKLPRDKWRRPDYLPRTIGKALMRRAELSKSNGQNRTTQSEIIHHIETGRALRDHSTTTVSYGTPLVEGGAREGLISNMLAFGVSVASGISAGDWNVGDGWIRFPVSAFASVHGVERKTVQRAIDAAERRGLIESCAPRKSQGGRVVCHRLIRLVETGGMLMGRFPRVALIEREEAA